MANDVDVLRSRVRGVVAAVFFWLDGAGLILGGRVLNLVSIKFEATGRRANLLLSLRAIATLAILLTVGASRAAAQNADYLATSTPGAWNTPSAETIAQGKADFLKYCAPCHSENGKGNGPEAKMIPDVKPKDLTRISYRNGGVFPYQQVVDTIDGRDLISSYKHFGVYMPFWGVRFQQSGKEFSAESEAKAKVRIGALVDYIATIQQK